MAALYQGTLGERVVAGVRRFGDEANTVTPHRPSMAPIMVMNGGQVFLVTDSSGGGKAGGLQE